MTFTVREAPSDGSGQKGRPIWVGRRPRNTYGTSSAPFVFHRLFGDATGEELPVIGNQHVAVVAIDDNFSFRSAFNNSATYKAYFDFDGDGAIGVADNFQFRSRFNRPLTWSV